jgi:hypothetical protein
MKKRSKMKMTRRKMMTMIRMKDKIIMMSRMKW